MDQASIPYYSSLESVIMQQVIKWFLKINIFSDWSNNFFSIIHISLWTLLLVSYRICSEVNNVSYI